jgi:drug/metabolite transporter (DMT)-like permease
MRLRDGIEWVVLAAIWGASFLFTRIAAPEFGPLALVEVRLAVAGAFLLVPVVLRGEWMQFRQHWSALLLLGAINSAIPFSLFAYATLSLTAGDASVLNATAPLFGALIGGLLLRERLPFGRSVGLCVGFLGVIVLVWDKLSFAGHGLAVGAGLGAALLYGFASHLINRRLRGVPSLAVSAGSLVFASMLLLPLALLNLPSALPSARGWFAAITLGVLCTAIAYLMYFHLLKNIGPTRAMTVAYLIPAFGILWGNLVLREPISLSTLIGGLVIVSGTMLVHFTKVAPQPTSDEQSRVVPVVE